MKTVVKVLTWVVGLMVIFSVLVFVKPGWFSWFFSEQTGVGKSVSLFTGILAFATLLLGRVTLSSIENTANLEEQHNKEARERENRDREERWVNEAIEWATDVLKLNSDLYRLTENVRLGLKAPSPRDIDEIYSYTIALRDRGKYLRVIVKALGICGDDTESLFNELTSIAGLLDTVNPMAEFGSDEDAMELITTDTVDGVVTPPEEKDTVEKHRKELATKCNSLIDKTSAEKVALLGNSRHNL